jgi:hypothetical protein
MIRFASSRAKGRPLDDPSQAAERVPVVAITRAGRLVGRVRQQMPDLHGRFTLHRDAELRYGRIQIEAAVLHQLQEHSGSVRLRQRGQVIDRVIPCGYAALCGGHPEATGPHDALIFGNRGRHAGNPQVGA